ncbi:hypothetical protein PV11_05566 [Exophiala sideris]|uniref:Uncharacterized protein n=1 Tax=Exophiala sideris TaxID=1016849 RepID=A0A0D1YL62_9EURO|nr:hypothetical protein PV11_05566 [Exophiala sideris]
MELPVPSPADTTIGLDTPGNPASTKTAAIDSPVHYREQFKSWKSLSSEARNHCISTECCRHQYGQQKAWPAAGMLERAWNTTIFKTMLDILNDEENQSKFGGFRRRRKPVLLSPMLFMLSKSGVRADAIPCVVLLVPKKRKSAAEKATGFLKQHKSLQAYGFQYTWQVEEIAISADNNASPGAGSPHQSDHSLCGRTVLVCPSSNIKSSPGRLTTVGGVLGLGPGTRYAMTCAHVFYDFGTDDDDSTEEASSDDSDLDDTYASSTLRTSLSQRHPSNHVLLRPLPPESLDLLHYSQWSETDLSSTAEQIGSFLVNSPYPYALVPMDLIFNARLDWALVEITDPIRLKENIFEIGGTRFHPHPQTSTKLPPNGDVVILWEFLEPRQVPSLATKTALNLPWTNGFVEVWAIECKSGPGACGAWVVEPDSGDVVGIVVAHCTTAPLTWMLPAYEVFADINSRWEAYEMQRAARLMTALVPSMAPTVLRSGNSTPALHSDDLSMNHASRPYVPLSFGRSQASQSFFNPGGRSVFEHSEFPPPSPESIHALEEESGDTISEKSRTNQETDTNSDKPEPFQKAVIIDVVDGYLNPGDKIIVRVGDTRHGSRGTRAQTFVEENFLMRWYVDPVGTSRFAPIKPDIAINIRSGPIAKLKVLSPRVVKPHSIFPIHAHTEDAWGNATVNQTDLRAVIRILTQGTRKEVSQISLLMNGQGWTHASSNFTAGEAGAYIITLSVVNRSGNVLLRHVDHLCVEASLSVPRILFADLHVHSDDTVGTNSTSYNFSYAQKIAGLDIVGYTANDFNITHERWNKTLDIIRKVNRPGQFVVYPGTEWCGNSAAGGDHNVVFLDDPSVSKPEFPFDRKGNVARSSQWNEDGPAELVPIAWPLDEVYATYAHSPESHLLIPHVGGRRCNLAWHHPSLERLLEIGSAWGQFEWLLQDAVRRG